MAKELHVHFEGSTVTTLLIQILTDLKNQIADVKVLLETLIQKENKMAVDLTNLRNEVAGISTVAESAVALIKAIAAKLAEMAQQPTVNPADLQAFADQLHTESANLGAAVTENTPAA